jgi:threonine/homoserine/homoserine lactone efflux protein
MTIMARTIAHGAASGLAYGAGTVLGILTFLTLAALGLSIIATEMSVVMTILRYAGAAYLIWMGIRLWVSWLSRRAKPFRWAAMKTTKAGRCPALPHFGSCSLDQPTISVPENH